MQATVLGAIRKLRQMSVGELREEWKRLHDGEETRSCNRDFLFKRLAWRTQELAYGGLSDRARARAAELAREADLRIRPPRGALEILERPAAIRPHPNPSPRRDARLPSPGMVLTRRYKDQEIQVRVTDDGFEWKGRPYTSLSAVARAVTGQKWNGRLFFGLTVRKRGS